MKTIFFETISSTNLYLKENYESLQNNTWVVTNHQTNGRGRLGRTWIDNDDLLFSILIKEDITNPLKYSFIIASCILNVLQKLGLKPSVKWPNDIMLNDKKVCGILLEGVSKQQAECVIIGVGINCNSLDFSSELKIKATSLKKELHVIIDKNNLLKMIQEQFNKEIKSLSYIQNIKDNFYLLNKDVYFEYNNKIINGFVKGMTDDGKIIIESGNNILKISSGEISLHNIYKK